jgi:hypothetical protein
MTWVGLINGWNTWSENWRCEMAKEVDAGQGVIIKIPENTVRLEITASVMDEDGNVVKAHTTFNPSDVYAIRKDFLDYVYYDDYDAYRERTERYWLG